MTKQKGLLENRQKNNIITVCIISNYKYEYPSSAGMRGTMERVKGGGWRMKPYPL